MVWAMLLALLLACTCGASREEQTISSDVAFLRLGPNAVCGDAVAGHTLICFDPATPVPIGFGATLRVSPAQLTVASGNTTIGITAQGAVVVNGAAAGPPGTLTLAGTRINRIDGVWTVLRETLLSPSGAVQEVCVISTTVCGIRLVLSADEPSIAVVAGNRIIIDDDIPLPFVLGALSSGTAHVISRWNIFSAQSHGELVIETQLPIDGTTTCRLHQFVNSSRCGRAYYRHEIVTVLPLNECFVLTDATRAALDADESTVAALLDSTLPLGVRFMTGLFFTNTECDPPHSALANVSLGVCDSTGRFMFDCMSAL